MKGTIFAIVCVLVFVSCGLPTGVILPESESLVPGLWGGYQIQTAKGVFQTPVGIRTTNKQVEVVLHDGQWYVWNNGYGIKIEKVE